MPPEIDHKTTRANARQLLKQYRRLNRIAGNTPITYRSPLLEATPPHHSNANVAENAVIDRIGWKLEAVNMLAEIDAALWQLTQLDRITLVYCYCVAEVATLSEIADLIHVANEDAVDYRKRLALDRFSETYNMGELIVYKNGGDRDEQD